MGTVAQKLQAALNSKNAIKQALTAKGKNPGDVLSDYAGLILELNKGKYVWEKWTYTGDKYLNSLAVGNEVSFNVGGTPTPFIVAHKGNPNPSIYDTSCDGVWLVAKDNLPNFVQYTATNTTPYPTSNLASEYEKLYEQMDARARAGIKQVKIPYNDGTTVHKGTNGTPVKLFAPSLTELGGGSHNYAVVDGAKLDYFIDNTTATETRKTPSGGVYWTRSRRQDNMGYALVVNGATGGISMTAVTRADFAKARIAMVMDPSTLYDITPGTYQGCEVSDNINEFPEDGVKDGFYYKRYHAGEPEVYILKTSGGEEAYAQLSSEAPVKLTATPNDIRIGTRAVTDKGVTDGSKDIPAYHTTTGYKAVKAHEKFEIQIQDGNRYDYTELQAMTMPWNTTLEDSVAVDRAVMANKVYPAGQTAPLATVTKDSANKSISLGITNGSEPAIIRFFTYKEEA